MTDSQNINLDSATVVRIARHVTWVGFWVNAALGLGKILAGVFGRSSAMIADGVHSFSDFVTDIIVIIFVGISRRKANDNFQYGHGKYETFATMLLALILGAVAVIFFVDGAEKTWLAFHGTQLPRPTWLALGTAIVSIISKEWLYHYPTGRREDTLGCGCSKRMAPSQRLIVVAGDNGRSDRRNVPRPALARARPNSGHPGQHLHNDCLRENRHAGREGTA